jgi:hypothetical protein
MRVYSVTHLKYCISSVSASAIFIIVAGTGDWQGLTTLGTIGLYVKSGDLLQRRSG